MTLHAPSGVGNHQPEFCSGKSIFAGTKTPSTPPASLCPSGDAAGWTGSRPPRRQALRWPEDEFVAMAGAEARVLLPARQPAAARSAGCSSTTAFCCSFLTEAAPAAMQPSVPEQPGKIQLTVKYGSSVAVGPASHLSALNSASFLPVAGHGMGKQSPRHGASLPLQRRDIRGRQSFEAGALSYTEREIVSEGKQHHSKRRLSPANAFPRCCWDVCRRTGLAQPFKTPLQL